MFYFYYFNASSVGYDPRWNGYCKLLAQVSVHAVTCIFKILLLSLSWGDIISLTWHVNIHCSYNFEYGIYHARLYVSCAAWAWHDFFPFKADSSDLLTRRYAILVFDKFEQIPRETISKHSTATVFYSKQNSRQHYGVVFCSMVVHPCETR